GLAQRIEQLAEAGEVYPTPPTAGLVPGYFPLEDPRPLPLKGGREPGPAYPLAGGGPLGARADASPGRGVSRLVGRAEETAALEAALSRALAGAGQVVGVVAEPGVGKSRLCEELVQRVRARGIAVNAAHCVAHGRMIPLLPVLEYLRGYFGIGDD